MYEMDLAWIIIACLPVLAFERLKHWYTRIPGYLYTFAIAIALYGLIICGLTYHGIVGEIGALFLFVPVILMSGWFPGYSLVTNMAGMPDIKASLNYISLYAMSGSDTAHNYAQSLRQSNVRGHAEPSGGAAPGE